MQYLKALLVGVLLGLGIYKGFITVDPVSFFIVAQLILFNIKYTGYIQDMVNLQVKHTEGLQKNQRDLFKKMQEIESRIAAKR